MRVLVATDTIGSLSSARAGALVATGWPGAEVTVVSLGEAGAGFVQALADQLGVDRVFSRGTTPAEVASFLVHALVTRRSAA